MNRINEEINKVLNKWLDISKQNNEYNFVYDGLMNDSKIINLNWNKNPIRLVFVMKEPYYQNINLLSHDEFAGEDYRLYHSSEMAIYNNIWRWLSRWTYAIYNTTKYNNPSFEIADKKENWEFTESHYPFAVINLKKTVGSSSISNLKLKKYAIDHLKYLKKQLCEIIKPNIIFCCGTSGIVLETIYKDLNFKKLDANGCGFYNKENNLLLLANYHPSARVTNTKKYYPIIDAYKIFLKTKII